MFKFLAKHLGMDKESVLTTKVETKKSNEVYTLEELLKVEQNENNSWWIAKSLQRNNKLQVPNWNGLPVVYLKNGSNGANVYLVGTKHTAPRSVEIVKEVITKIRPDYVMVELRKVYYDQKIATKSITRLLNSTISSLRSFIYRIFEEKSACFLWIFGLFDGEEMRTAIKEGQKVGARIILGDEYTNEEIYQFHGVYYFNYSIEERINAIRDEFIDMETLCLQEHDFWKKYYTIAFSNFNAQRERKMTNTLWQLKGNVVGVVGRLHLNGIQELWHKKTMEEWKK